MMKTVERKGEEKISRRSWVDQFYTEIDQTQRRFNYFLVTSSILLFAFAFGVSGGFPNGTWIVFPLGALGAFLSLYFFWINYFQSRVAEMVRSRHFTQPVPEDKMESEGLLQEGWYAAWKYPFRAFKLTGGMIVSYTWFIPFAVFLLWLVLLGVRMGFYGFSLIAVPLAIQAWFSRHFIVPAVRQSTARFTGKTVELFKEIKANGSTGLEVEKQALARLVQRTLRFLKKLTVICRKTFSKIVESLFRLFRRYSGSRGEAALNREEPE